MSYPVRRSHADRFGRLFSEFFSDPYGYPGGRPAPWQPDIDVSETSDAWLVEVRLAGFAPEEVTVELSDRELAIGARDEKTDFSYRFTVPSDVDAEKIEATMDHGLLTVRLPRSAANRPRRIAIGRPNPTPIEGTTS